MKHILLFVVVLVLFVPARRLAAQGRIARVQQTCYAEVKWNNTTDLRSGPGTSFDVKRELNWQDSKIRVFARNEAKDWFQGVIETTSVIGWISIDKINLYGNCDNLPVTEGFPEPARPPIPPPLVPLPEFAASLNIPATDEIWRLNEGMLYIRHTSEQPLLQWHMIVADLDNPKLDVKVHIGAKPFNNVTLVSDMVLEAGAMVAINGDFYSGNFMPQGLTVLNGEVITAPKRRAVFAITPDNKPFIGRFTDGWTWPASIVAQDGAYLPLQLMNAPCDPRWICLFSDYIGGLPMRTGFDGFRVLLSPEFEVLSIELASGYMPIPENHYVLVAGQYTSTGQWVEEHLKPGDHVILNLTTEPAWQQFEYAIGGGPIILEDGQFRQDCDPDIPEETRDCEEFEDLFRLTHYFDNYIPRASVGYDEDENILFLIMVEGYEVDHSDGITQRGLAQIYMDYGAEYAMEFDGGGSSSLWVGETFVNDLPVRGERHLSNALMLFWDN